MRITRVEIENFRSIRHLAMDLGKTTVLVGPNNSGKTAILDAIRIALTRRWGQRGTGFSEYDIHMSNEAEDPKSSSGVTIELRSEERESREWPDAIVEDLGDIVQLDLVTGLRSVRLRTRCVWNADTDSFEPSWEFLDVGREPLVGIGARRVNLERFWRYIPVFYLDALRDVKDEFSARSSQFWNRLLKDLNIPPELESRAMRVLDLLNRRLLKADPRLADIANTLSGATRVAARDKEGGLDLRMVPLKTWDLLSRAEIILRNEAGLPWLPLRRQGQGLQSLAVIFLFQAFVDHLLRELYEAGSEPMLALEEPETHLHPQAVRTLWHQIDALPGQKIVTTHSPYFVQQVPFRDLRLVRLNAGRTEVRSLPASFSVSIPNFDGLETVVEKTAGLLSYEPVAKLLTVHGVLDDTAYRELLTRCALDERRAELEPSLRDLRDRSSLHVADDELQALETYARRMRGEVFFAERWLLVEGQADYLLVHAIGYALNYDLDRHGVSVIDAQNNGSPATFAALARAMDIPWLAVFDGDAEGRRFNQRIQNRGFDASEIEMRCGNHSNGDLEQQLVADGLGQELRETLQVIGVENAESLNNEDLVRKLRKRKTDYAAVLAARVRSDSELAARMPTAFRDAIDRLRGLP
ncbi:MAG: AAA family ATPase [Gammaproteobacteria bacterium]|nr:AAA family ATPase [Gammaproteobacteria bacterium]